MRAWSNARSGRTTGFRSRSPRAASSRLYTRLCSRLATNATAPSIFVRLAPEVTSSPRRLRAMGALALMGSKRGRLVAAGFLRDDAYGTLWSRRSKPPCLFEIPRGFPPNAPVFRPGLRARHPLRLSTQKKVRGASPRVQVVSNCAREAPVGMMTTSGAWRRKKPGRVNDP